MKIRTETSYHWRQEFHDRKPLAKEEQRLISSIPGGDRARSGLRERSAAVLWRGLVSIGGADERGGQRYRPPRLHLRSGISYFRDGDKQMALVGEEIC